MSAEGTIVANISPQPGRPGLARTRRQRWQGGLVGKDPFALFDTGQDVVGQGLKLKADLAHPLRHLCAVDLDAIACVDRFLAVERQTIGIFCHRDLRQQRFGGNTTLDDPGGRSRLCDAVKAPVGVFGTLQLPTSS